MRKRTRLWTGAAALILLCSLMLFAGGRTAYADGDVLYPQLDPGSIKAELLHTTRTVARAGDTVRISMTITDESEITSRYFQMKKPITGTEQTFGHLKREEGTDTWYYDIPVTDDTENGVWKITAIRLEDEYGNYVWYHNTQAPDGIAEDANNKKADLSGGNFKVNGTHPDTEPPVIDLSSLTVSPKNAVPGKEVTISVKVTDNKAVDEVDLWVRRPNGVVDSWLVMTYNGAKDRYEYKIAVTEETMNGRWDVTCLRAYDKQQLYQELDSDEGADLSAATFHVSGGAGETNAPVIKKAGLKVTLPAGRTKVGAGEEVKMAVTVTDDTEVRWVEFWYIMPQTSVEKAYYPSYNEKTGKWEHVLLLEEGAQTGRWKLSKILALDIYDNEAVLYNSAVGSGTPAADLSAGDFFVERSIAKAAVTNIKSKSYTGKPQTQTPRVTLDGVVLKEGRDYTISYKNNIEVGKATMTITGTGDYAGKISKTFTIKQAKMPFLDVEEKDYFYDAVLWANVTGVVKGTSVNTFSPYRNLKRGEFCTMLWRMFGKPTVTAADVEALPFADAKASNHSKAIAWCYRMKIINGYKDGTFKPARTITRGNILVMLFKIAKQEPDYEKTTISNPFTDVKNSSSAIGAYKWAYANGITKDKTLRPQVACIRADMVCFLYGYNNRYHTIK